MAARAAGGGQIAANGRAFDYVKNQILTGALRGGELVSEGEIAETLGVSRTPVREAFLRLQVEGFLRLYPQRGALVVPVSPEEVRAVLEARLVLEQFAAGKLAGQEAVARHAVFGRMKAELDRQREAEPRAFLDADRAFHGVLVGTAGNYILEGVYDSLRDRQMRMIGESTVREPDRMRTILGEHQRIAEAVRDGDRARALDAVSTHLAGTRSALGFAV
ncbi:MAG TPA: GntR family transcriptional regulator [Streptosporangiaceae bacterium]|nr:GntR family transcriptional regulator [Streptosporangiaceae bacterium]